MNDENKPAANERNTVSYPQKYWWLLLVLLPLALALIKIIPDLRSKKPEPAASTIRQGGTGNTLVTGSANILNSDLSTKTYVINMPAIEKEYLAAKGEPLADGEFKKQIETAIALLNEGKAKESAAAFEKINQKVSLPSLQTNLGVAYEKAGNTKAAEQTFSKVLAQDPGYSAAQQNLDVISTSRGELVESKSNNEADQANVLPLEKTVSATITDKSDSDFFKIRSPVKYRDIINVHLENKSTTLQPGISMFDSNKSALGSKYDDTPGAKLDYPFSVQPETVYFVQVYGRWGSAGRYTVTVKPLKKYDAYEPNDNILQPAPIEIGKQIDANIMDGEDVDFYRFKTGGNGATVKVHVQNQSTTLQPGISVFDSNKSALGGNNNDTRGANVDHPFSVQPDAFYFVEIYGRWHSEGDYSLLITQQ